MADLGLENKEDGEQKGYRPVVVIQNDRGNRHAPTVIVASITSRKDFITYSSKYKPRRSFNYNV